MASKYINLEAAATQLSIPVEELNRLRESGQIRGFSDRGTWKFKAEDIEALSRTIKPDSQFDIPGMDDDDDMISFMDDLDLTGGSQIVLEEEMGDQPTVISKKSPNIPPGSDSDVRLVIDPSLESDSWNKQPTPPKTTSDSALRQGATPSQTPLRADSEDDSNLSLSDAEDQRSGISDSEVRLAPIDLDDGGSDLTLAADSGISKSGETPASMEISDSDVALVGDANLFGDGGSDITLAPDDDSAPRLLDADDSSVLDEEEGPGSGLVFSGDSGISLDLVTDSGISLGGDDDPSLALAADSGISLIPDSGIGLTLDDSYQLQTVDESTIPMLGVGGDDEADTSFDMPLLSDDDDSSAEEETTNVVMFDDDDAADTMEFDSTEMSEDEFVDFDDDGDNFDQLSDDELDVADSGLLDDDDVLDADDEAFEDDFESGESVSALPVPGGARGGAAVAVASEWDMVSFSMVLISTLLMGICTLLMYDLVRSMWSHQTPININGTILDALQGLIKS